MKKLTISKLNKVQAGAADYGDGSNRQTCQSLEVEACTSVASRTEDSNGDDNPNGNNFSN